MNRLPQTKVELEMYLRAQSQGGVMPAGRPSLTVTIPARLQKRLARRAEDLGISFGELVTHFLLKGLDGD